MSDREPILEAKRRLPLPDLMRRLDLGDHAKKSAPCLFHEDANNSFSVYESPAGWAWKCHAGCGTGDEITMLEKVRGIGRGDAIKLFLSMAGVTAEVERLPEKEKQSKLQLLKWDESPAGTFDTSIAPVIAEDRGYSVEFVIWLHKEGLIGTHKGGVAFPNHDEVGRVVSCHYNGSRRSWLYDPTGYPVRPLIIGNIAAAIAVMVFESQWDALAVADKVRMHLPGAPNLAFVITRGAGNGKLVKGLVPVGQRVFAWKQNDPEKNGKRAGDVWLNDVAAAAAGVEVLWVVTPMPHKDANDWTWAGAIEAEILAAVKNAGTVTPPEPEHNSQSSGKSSVTRHPEPEKPDATKEPVYYDIARKEYLVPDARGRWIANNDAQFKRRCKIRGISTRSGEGLCHSPYDAYVTDLQHDHGVDFVGPLAGYPAGLHDYEDRRLLVTSGPKLPTPTPGECHAKNDRYRLTFGRPVRRFRSGRGQGRQHLPIALHVSSQRSRLRCRSRGNDTVKNAPNAGTSGQAAIGNAGAGGGANPGAQ